MKFMEECSSATSTRANLSESDYRAQADFRSALRRFLHFSEEQARAAGFTPQQYLLLLAIRGHPDHPEVSIGDVAEAMQLRHHSVSLLIDRGVKRGLVHRKEDRLDRRRALVSLTREGQAVLDQVMLANRRELQIIEDVLWRDSFRSARKLMTNDRAGAY